VKVAHPTNEATLHAWCARVELAPDLAESRLLATVGDLIDAIDHRPSAALAAIHRFAFALGTDGWPIAQVSTWLAALAQCVGRPQRKVLRHYSAHSAMAQGWADGYVRGAHSGQCIDPSTGLVTAMVLRLRLLELYQHAAAATELPSALHVLVLVDIDVRELTGLDADLRMATVAQAVAAVFCHGDTVARVGQRVVVLAGNTEHTEQRMALLVERLRLDPSTRAARATVLADTPPPRAELLDAYLRDVAG
jgi:hypothetical protein